MEKEKGIMKYKTRFFLFFFVMVLFNLAANFAHPVTPTVIQDLNLHDYMFGLALAAMMLTNFLLSPFWGKINEYISSRMSLLICCMATASPRSGSPTPPQSFRSSWPGCSPDFLPAVFL